MHRSTRALAAAALTTALAGGALVGTDAADAAPPRLTPWNNAMILPVTIGPRHLDYSIRIIGDGEHEWTTQELYGTAGGVAAQYVVEVAPGSRVWTLGHPHWRGVVLRVRMDAQRTEYLETDVLGAEHYRSVAALRARIAVALSTDRGVVAHAVGGDLTQLGRQGRARTEAAEVANRVRAEVELDADGYAALLRREDATVAPTDPALLDLADRSTVRDWQRANGLAGSSRAATWSADLVAASRGPLHAGRNGVNESVRYHRSVVVSGNAAAWTATVTDLDDAYAVTWTSTAKTAVITE